MSGCIHDSISTTNELCYRCYLQEKKGPICSLGGSLKSTAIIAVVELTSLGSDSMSICKLAAPIAPYYM
jgi:hypothetical protein